MINKISYETIAFERKSMGSVEIEYFGSMLLWKNVSDKYKFYH